MCLIEKDEKTFDYFKKYFIWLENKDCNCLMLDNEIQYHEIKKHLELNGKEENDVNEAIKWIDGNASKFREYLDTIKILYIAVKFRDPAKTISDINWEDFCEMTDFLNGMKLTCGISYLNN